MSTISVVGRRRQGEGVDMRCGASRSLGVLTSLACAAGCGAKGGASSSPSTVMINEVMAANVLTIKDENGAPAPWVELYNAGGADVDLGGYGVTDDFSKPRQSVLPAGLVVRAGGYLVLWCDGNPAAGRSHVAATLDPTGGTIGLARPDGTLVQRVTYGAQAVDLSAAREPDGAASWTIEWAATPGAANPAGTAPSPPSSSPASQPVPAQPETVPAAGDLTDRILAYDTMPELNLDIAEADLATLRTQTTATDATTWVTGTLEYQGRKYGPVGISLKGTRSFQTIDQKAAFRVSIKKYVKDARFFGLEELILNNMTTDNAMMHERIAYWIARQIGGLPGLRANHARVSVNGELYGLYANVEAPSLEFIAHAYKDAEGSLYSIHYADFQPQYMAGFNLQVGPGDSAQLQAVTDALTLAAPDQAMAQVGAHVDMQEFARYWAYCIVVGQFSSKWPYAAQGETVGNDAGLYEDPSSQLMTFIPEGTDDTFYDANFDFRKTNSLLTETCKKSPACFQAVVSQVWSILAQAEQLGWAAEVDRVAAQIAPDVAADPRKPYSDATVASYQQQMKYFITGRRAALGAYIAAPSP
jgi:hypothetical protein